MTSVQTVKKQAGIIIREQRKALDKLCLDIHGNPETGLKEQHASTWLADYLERNGFKLEKGTGGLNTAFRASYGCGRPAIALLAEYDALPEIGHACGHNLIAAAAAGAAVGSVPAVDAYGGRVMVIGTPSEEFHSGKELLLRHGVFEGIDMAMMIHPGNRDVTTINTLACITLSAEFRGQEAHASANPEEGINALEAMLLSFNAVNSLRQHIPGSARIHGIITNGGRAANIVPGYSSAMFMVRAADSGYLEILKEKVADCFKGAARATGALLDYTWAEVSCQPMLNNTYLAEIFNRNMAAAGRQMETGPGNFASTDMGNVSHFIPSIHPVISIAPEGVPLHSTGFLYAAASEKGLKGMLDSAIAMAFTVSDVLSQPEMLATIKKEFRQCQTPA